MSAPGAPALTADTIRDLRLLADLLERGEARVRSRWLGRGRGRVEGRDEGVVEVSWERVEK